MLADWLIQDDLREGRLVTLFPDYRCAATVFDTAAWVLYPNRTYLPQKVRVMIDFLRSKMRAAAR
jgi:DNA-binding transcriptional LysR family regulator